MKMGFPKVSIFLALLFFSVALLASARNLLDTVDYKESVEDSKYHGHGDHDHHDEGGHGDHGHHDGGSHGHHPLTTDFHHRSPHHGYYPPTTERKALETSDIKPDHHDHHDEGSHGDHGHHDEGGHGDHGHHPLTTDSHHHSPRHGHYLPTTERKALDIKPDHHGYGGGYDHDHDQHGYGGGYDHHHHYYHGGHGDYPPQGKKGEKSD
ncbi:hypothetical protein V2J09_014016 [Rumex salicifolius]